MSKLEYELIRLKKDKFASSYDLNSLSKEYLLSLGKKVVDNNYTFDSYEIILKSSGYRYFQNYLAHYNVIGWQKKQKIEFDIFAKTVNEYDMSFGYEFMKFLHKKYKNTNFSVNKPLSYIKKYNMVYYEGIVGDHFEKLLNNNNFEIKNYLKEIVKFLAYLHKINVPASIKNNHNFQNYYAIKFTRIFAHYRVHYPNFMSDYPILELLLKNIDVCFKYYNNYNKGITHQDFGFHNLFFNSNKIGVIDFSAAAWADPAMDLGSLIAQGLYMDLFFTDRYSEKKVNELIKFIKEEYLMLRPEKNLSERVDIYTAWYLIQIGGFLWKMNSQKKTISQKKLISKTEKIFTLADKYVSTVVKKENIFNAYFS